MCHFLVHIPAIFINIWGGSHLKTNAKISPQSTIVGAYSNLYMDENSEINYGAFVLLKGKVHIGENSTIAYKAKIITSANPNGPYNSLSKIYPSIIKPVVIGKNCWIGAGVIILPGVTIGDYSVVAAGAVVNKDVPSGVLVAGVPCRVVKKLEM